MLRFLPKSHQYRMTERPGPAHKVTNPELRATGATTLISGGVPKPQLMAWYARTTAEYVRDNPLEVERLRNVETDPEGFAMVKELAKAPERVRDAAAERGSMVHDYAEKLLHGEAVDIPDDLAPYVDGYLRLIDEWEITPVLTETSVGNRKDWYVGRLDSIVRIGKLGNCLVLLDWKTSRGVYGETALQTAGYAKAEFYVTDDEPDVEIPLPQVDRTMVCHITPEGSFLYDLAKTPAEIDRHYELFLAAAFTHKTAKERDAIITEPLTLPIESKEMSAAA
ncbi:RecE-like exonuclease [Arthrobacter phage Hirko]|nr:RecE-like exonuclease [Arthrobacter phage Hirko]